MNEIYANSKMRHIYAYPTDESDSIWDNSCEVVINGSDISVKYYNPDHGFNQTYKGKDQGNGHYKLNYKGKSNDEESIIGKATLHQLDKIIEGWWFESLGDENYEGAWKIELIK